jgi:hypothetical protein
MQVFRNWNRPKVKRPRKGKRLFASAWCFATRRAYDRERADLVRREFGKGERRLPQGVLTCGVSANLR